MDRVRELIKDIRIYGINNNVPIMSEETISVINDIISENKVSSILEIGTAIGYSTICFASNEHVKRIVSVERDEVRENIAKENVSKSKFNHIELIYGDALLFETDELFDLVIIDAAKSQNIKFFNKYKHNLKENGIMIIDNLDFHGYVGRSNEIKSRNLRQMVRKIEKFLTFLSLQDEFDYEFIEVGDRLGVCKRKNI